MASAEKSDVVPSIFHLEVCLDDKCGCKSGHTSTPDYLQREMTEDGVVLTISSPETSTRIKLPGVPKDEAIISAFANCRGPIKLDEALFACGALAELTGVNNG